MKFEKECKVHANTTRDFDTYVNLEPQDFLRIHESDLAALLKNKNKVPELLDIVNCIIFRCEGIGINEAQKNRTALDMIVGMICMNVDKKLIDLADMVSVAGYDFIRAIKVSLDAMPKKQ